ncbi:hypothetical protein [Bradyrhizobium sp. CCGB01]|uniref:hypothetical protein n=1 Tax=Bradyrhizobium sp. CCGB01 TaxID=2949634 RepID=UPI0020B41080|nr:hypothetical protein [Bradyrhizobium sp. CCGB01]MCP3405609.1 hypothetical protein [Bradyrhizobium sp. CCGB01]
MDDRSDIAASLLNAVFPLHQTRVQLAGPSLGQLMTPLQIISDWLEKQDAEVQSEVANMAAFMVFDISEFIDYSGQERTASLRQWLTEVNLPTYTVLSRALKFRSCFEHFAERRFTEAGWTRSEEVLRKALEEAERDARSDAAGFVSTARRILDEFSIRRSCWIEAGKAWRKLANTYLTSRALREWTTSQIALRTRVSSQGNS